MGLQIESPAEPPSRSRAITWSCAFLCVSPPSPYNLRYVIGQRSERAKGTQAATQSGSWTSTSGRPMDVIVDVQQTSAGGSSPDLQASRNSDGAALAVSGPSGRQMDVQNAPAQTAITVDGKRLGGRFGGWLHAPGTALWQLARAAGRVAAPPADGSGMPN